MGQLPTTQRPVSDEPTYTTDAPTYFEPTTPSPTSVYGYGEDYHVASVFHSKSGKRGSKAAKGNRDRGSKSSKSGRGSKSGKGSKKKGSNGKSSKSAEGGDKYEAEYYDNKYGYERRRKDKNRLKKKED